MHIVTKQAAPRYDAPGHAGMQMRRLQGLEAGPSESVWIGMSDIEPGGGTTAAASPLEKFYVVFEGELLVECGNEPHHETATLYAGDSCRIAPNEVRRLLNASTTAPCRVVLVMPLSLQTVPAR
jgi:mannose-6-phosphate isomerase-like protein (cupin superfamily)